MKFDEKEYIDIREPFCLLLINCQLNVKVNTFFLFLEELTLIACY